MKNPFASLLPDFILQTIEDQGYQTTGTFYPLNSYENRVYDVGVANGESLIVKFYRPGRWSKEAIAEEHKVLEALSFSEVPVIGPKTLKKSLDDIGTLGRVGTFYYALYSRFKGKHKDEFRSDDLKNLGKLIAQMHNVMELIPIKHRPWLDVNLYGFERLKFIMSQPFIEDDLKVSIDHHIQKALKLCENNFLNDWECIPVHGDCHIGNILWNMDGPHFLDFDDFLIAPPAFDVWMLFSGDQEETKNQKKDFFSGYEMFREFDHDSLILTEVFRTLRLIHHAAWIGERYSEEAFRRAFPYYNERRYWEQFLLNIKEQISLLQEPYVV